MSAAIGDPAVTRTGSALSDIRSLLARRLEDVQAAISRLDLRLSDAREARRDLTGRLSELEAAWQHVVENLGRFGPEDLDRTFRVVASTRADLAGIDERCRDLAGRLDDLHREEEMLRSIFQTLEDLAAGQEPLASGEEHLRSASRQVFQIIEEERMRIARDMHDGPAQSMANLVLQAEILERLIARDPNLAHQELADFKDGVRSVLDDTRRLIFDLRPMTLDDLGLIPTLRKFTREFSEKTGINARLLVVGEEARLPTAYENTLFRIIQEALNNVRKHSRASNVEITVSFSGHRASAVIQDDGVGFDVDGAGSGPDSGRHLGLTSMRERAQLEKGELEIRSQPGRGTEIRVSFEH